MGHEDHVVELPPGATLLASTERNPCQAYRFDDAPIYCTQFHPELEAADLDARFSIYTHYLETIPGMSFACFRETLEESARGRLRHTAPVHPLLISREIEDVLRARHPNVEESALLFEIGHGGVRDPWIRGSGVWKESLDAADEEYHLKLEAFGRVERRQRHLRPSSRLLFVGGVEREVVHQPLQGIAVRPCSRLEPLDASKQVANVLEPPFDVDAAPAVVS